MIVKLTGEPIFVPKIQRGIKTFQNPIPTQFRLSTVTHRAVSAFFPYTLFNSATQVRSVSYIDKIHRLGGNNLPRFLRGSAPLVFFLAYLQLSRTAIRSMAQCARDRWITTIYRT
jgi:hypothetical protein